MSDQSLSLETHYGIPLPTVGTYWAPVCERLPLEPRLADQ